jgi:hypothetical protein
VEECGQKAPFFIEYEELGVISVVWWHKQQKTFFIIFFSSDTIFENENGLSVRKSTDLFKFKGVHNLSVFCIVSPFFKGKCTGFFCVGVPEEFSRKEINEEKEKGGCGKGGAYKLLRWILSLAPFNQSSLF